VPETSQNQGTSSLITFFIDLLESFVIALGIFLVVYNFVAQPHRVRGDSMLPNYHNDEYILTEKVSYRLGKPERGDVVVLKYPVNPTVDFIKRVVGLPGETILLKDGNVYINNVLLNEPYLSEITATIGNAKILEGVPFTIPEGEYVVMGDNRARSSDSRAWGTVPIQNIRGKGFFVYWPPKEIGFIQPVTPTLNQ
jgi:signal peptidase I